MIGRQLAPIVLLLALATPAWATNDTLDTDSVATTGLTFSNGNLTVVGPAGAALANSGIAQSVEGKKAGKWCVSFTYNVASGNNDAVGIDTGSGVASGNLGQAGPNDGHTWGYYSSNGLVENNGSSQVKVNGAAYVATDRIDEAIDLDNKRLWWRKNSGLWVGTAGTPDPGTNTNGFDITSSLANNSRVYPAVNLSGGTAKFTADFTTGACSAGVPTGFTAGWTNTTAGTYFGTLLVMGQTGLGAIGLSSQPTGPNVSKYVASLTGSVSQIILTSLSSMTGTTVGVVYDATGASGGPGALLASSTNTLSASNFGELAYNYSGLSMTSGTTYWIGLSTSNVFQRAAAPLTAGYYTGNTAYTTTPTPNPFVISSAALNGRAGALVFVTPSSGNHRLIFADNDNQISCRAGSADSDRSGQFRSRTCRRG